MILRLFRQNPQDDNIACVYGAIVAQARLPAFYRTYAVPDTVNGRLEMILLHAALLLRRLDSEGQSTRPMGQGIFDAFCRDMDGNLREMGVGDLAVPAKMRAIGEAFYGRRRAYEAALAASDGQALAEALARNVHGSTIALVPVAERLSAYTRAAALRLQAQNIESLCSGKLGWPDPLEIAAVAAGG